MFYFALHYHFQGEEKCSKIGTSHICKCFYYNYVFCYHKQCNIIYDT